MSVARFLSCQSGKGQLWIPWLYAGDDGRSRWGEVADDVGGEGHVSRGVGLVDRASVYSPVGADETLPTSTRIASSVRKR
jgi:hypothetical protein